MQSSTGGRAIDWLLLIIAIAAAGVIGAKALAVRATAANIVAEYGPLLDRGRIGDPLGRNYFDER